MNNSFALTHPGRLALALATLLPACRPYPHAREVAGLERLRSEREASGHLWDQPIARTVETRPAQPAVPALDPASAAVVRPRLGDDRPCKLDLRGAALSEALHLIATQAGVNIYLDAGLDQPVDASFPAVTLDDALAVLLERNALVLAEDPPGVFWVTPRDDNALLTRRFTLQSIAGADFLDNLKALVPAATLVVDPNSNFVVARAAKRDQDMIADYLLAADRVKRQVLIEVEVLEIVLEDGFELGVQSLLDDPNFLGEAGLSIDQRLATASDAFSATIDFAGIDLTTTINALEHYGKVNVLSSPRVLAITNTKASIDVIREIPYVETTTAITGGAGTVGTTSQQTIAFKEAGIKLMVTPVIQENELVQLSVNQQFSEVVDTFQGIPVLDARRVENQFIVRGDQAVLLGGLMQNRRTEEDDGVPLLMHLPLLGRLFRSDNDTQERRELLVMITARVLDPEEAARLSRVYQQNFEQRVQDAGGVR